MFIAITGANGYIGERLVCLAKVNGYQVVALTRSPPSFPVNKWVHFDIGSCNKIELADNVRIVFHLATSFGTTTPLTVEQELLMAGLLMDEASRIGARFVFVSSQTARPDAPTPYGLTKWEIEQTILFKGGCVIRPGQVYGGPPRALFGKLCAIVKSLPVLPVFYPPPMVQPIHVDDLALGILRCGEISFDSLGEVLCIASPQPIAFSEFLISILKKRLRSNRLRIPVPTFLVRVMIKVFPFNAQLQQLDSLLNLPVMKTAFDLKKLNLHLRTLNEGMSPSGECRRRALLIEGNALIRYVLGKCPEHFQLRRYVRAIEVLRNRKAMNLPNLFLRLPAMLAVLDSNYVNRHPWLDEFEWRLNAATLIAEASLFGADSFLMLSKSGGPLSNSLEIAFAMLLDVFWRIVGIIFRPFLKYMRVRIS